MVGDIIDYLNSSFLLDSWDKLQYPFTRKHLGMSVLQDIQDGSVVKNLMKPGEFLSIPEHLGLILNTDGVQTFNSSKHSMWPVFLMVSNLPPQVRILEQYIILAAVWFGPKKPSNMSVILRPVLDKIKLLSMGSGMTVHTPSGDKKMKCVLLAGVFDLPAKAAVMNCIQYNGYYGCCYCTDKGIHQARRHLFPPNDAHTPRSEIEMSNWASLAENTGNPVFGVKGYSVLHRFVNIPNGIPIDYMHAVLEGVVKTLLKCWFSSEYHNRPFCLRPYIKQIDKDLCRIKPPHDHPRRPRSIESSLLNWKASEYRAFLLFYAIPILQKYLQAEYVHHLSLLVFSLTRLLSTEIQVEMLPEIQSHLELFYDNVPNLYSEKTCTANMHSLIHLVKFVIMWGPLWTISTFPFENANGVLKRQIHGTRNVLQQVIFMMKLREFFSFKTKALTNEATETHVHVGKVLSKEISFSHSRILGVPSPAMLFGRARFNNSMYYASTWIRPNSTRRSSTVSFYHNNEILFGEIEYFCLTKPKPLALIKILSAVTPTEIDDPDLNSFVKVQETEELVAIPVSALRTKCVLVPCDKTHKYLIPLPNNIECH